MAAISAQVNIADDRGEKERLPRGLPGVRRSLDDVNFRASRRLGDRKEAMLTARMTERMENTAAGQMATAVSYVVPHVDAAQRRLAAPRRPHRQRVGPQPRGIALTQSLVLGARFLVHPWSSVRMCHPSRSVLDSVSRALR